MWNGVEIQKIQENKRILNLLRSAFCPEFKWNARGKMWNGPTSSRGIAPLQPQELQSCQRWPATHVGTNGIDGRASSGGGDKGCGVVADKHTLRACNVHCLTAPLLRKNIF